MFELVALDSRRSGECLALAFCDDDDEFVDASAHEKPIRDHRQWCREKNHQALANAARHHTWCSPCTSMLSRLVITKDCRDCSSEFTKAQYHSIPYNNAMTYPDIIDRFGKPPTNSKHWWYLEDPDISQICDSKTTYGSDGLSPWPIPTNDTDGAGLSRLGFHPDCSICFGLARSLLATLQENTLEGSLIALRGLNFDKHCFAVVQMPGTKNSFSLRFNFEWDEWNDGTLYQGQVASRDLQFFVNKDIRNPWLCCYENNRLNPMFLKVALSKELLQCRDASERSTSLHNPGFPPSFRLIDVHRRCVVSVGGIFVMYSAISYRWDNRDTHVLTLENEHSFSQPGALSASTMSRTLYDCMMLARDLDIPYIWIDRYCIPQDDYLDTSETTNYMAQVYSRSWLTIICAPSNDIHSGLPGYSRNFVTSISLGNLEDYQTDSTSWKLWRWQTPPEWLTRAWTFQEELLSPRRLYMTDYATIWHIGCPTVVYPHTIHTPPEPVQHQCCVDARPPLHQILEMYLSRRLTYSEDRIAAIAGLLEKYGVEHVHGIATRDILYNLSWMPWRLEEQAEPCDLFPTWSWAHYFKQVTWLDRQDFKIRPRCQAWLPKTLQHKGRSLLRRVGLSATGLDDKTLLFSAKVRYLRQDECVRIDDAAQGYPTNEAMLIPLYTQVDPVWKDTALQFSLVVKPIPTPTGFLDGEGIHAIRIGTQCKVYRPRAYPHKPRLNRIRPMALQSVTRLKAFRIRHLRLGTRKNLVRLRKVNLDQRLQDSQIRMPMMSALKEWPTKRARQSKRATLRCNPLGIHNKCTFKVWKGSTPKAKYQISSQDKPTVPSKFLPVVQQSTLQIQPNAQNITHRNLPQQKFDVNRDSHSRVVVPQNVPSEMKADMPKSTLAARKVERLQKQKPVHRPFFFRKNVAQRSQYRAVILH